MTKEDLFVLQTVYEIRSVKKYIMKRYTRLNAKNKILINKEIYELKNFIDGNQSKIYSLVPLKKHLIRKLRLIPLKGSYGKIENMIERLINKHLTDDIIKCKLCKKPFIKKRKNNLFCSAKCRGKHGHLARGEKDIIKRI